MQQHIRFFILALVVSSVGVGLFLFFSSSSTDDRHVKDGAQSPQQYQYAGPWDKELFDGLYNRLTSTPDLPTIKGGIVPHHLLAGDFAARFFEVIKQQQPSTVILIGPNHFGRGHAPIITSERDWKTPYGEVMVDRELLSKVGDVVVINEDVVAEEHAIYSIVPFIARSVPNAKIVPFVVQVGAPTSSLELFIDRLIAFAPQDAVIVASIDFSHYQISSVADFHDAMAINTIETFNYDRIPNLEIDSPESLYVLLRLMDHHGTKKIAHALHTNAAKIAKNPGATNLTSYYTPFFTAGLAKQETTPTILHFGDMMLDRNVAKQIERHGSDYLFEELAGEELRFFSGVDVVGANLEGPVADSRRETSKEIAFRFKPSVLPMLQKYNFTHFSQANNHSYDMGKQAFAESINNLKEAGFTVYGEQYRVNAGSVAATKIGDANIAFIGVNDTNAPIDQDAALDLVRLYDKDMDYVIVNIHWGLEYKPVSHPRQRMLAHAFIDAGADVIIGHHPHVVQEVEVYKKKPIFYSLGNFIFDQYFSKETQQGLGIGLVLSSDQIKTYFFPIESELSKASLMPYEKAKLFMKKLVDRSRLDSYTLDNFELTIQ